MIWEIQKFTVEKPSFELFKQLNEFLLNCHHNNKSKRKFKVRSQLNDLIIGPIDND